MKSRTVTTIRLIALHALPYLMLFTACLSIAGYSFAYSPPLGIPAPAFGIDEVHTMYNGQQYDYNGDGTPDGAYGNAGNGPYTHYVDGTVACTDSYNTNGTLATPRCTFPDGASLHPGAVVEIHGGPYTSGLWTVTSSGNASKPIFIRGANISTQPIIESPWRIRGAYIIMENLNFDKNRRNEGAVDIRPDPADPLDNVHHVSLRYCSGARGYINTAANSFGAFVAASSYITSNPVHDIVYYKNSFLLDQMATFTPVDNFEYDYHAIGIDSNSYNLFVLENTISGCAGDGVGNGNNANHTTHHLYIGGNDISATGENAVDIKEIADVVISSNIFHDISSPSAGSPANALVVHYGASNPKKSILNGWIINNKIYNITDFGGSDQGTSAIQIGGTQQNPVWVMGNLIYGIKNSSHVAAGVLSWGSVNIDIVNNTITDSDIGISVTGTTPYVLTIKNNIISDMYPGKQHLEVANSAFAALVDIHNNLFYQPGGVLKILWGGSTPNYTTVAELAAATGKCSGCIQADPLFIDPSNRDFRIKFSSPAIDKALTPEVYTTFQNIFGIDIRHDQRGVQRPTGLQWDIGTYEVPSIVGKTGTFK